MIHRHTSHFSEMSLSSTLQLLNLQIWTRTYPTMPTGGSYRGQREEQVHKETQKQKKKMQKADAKQMCKGDLA